VGAGGLVGVGAGWVGSTVGLGLGAGVGAAVGVCVGVGVADAANVAVGPPTTIQAARAADSTQVRLTPDSLATRRTNFERPHGIS